MPHLEQEDDEIVETGTGVEVWQKQGGSSDGDDYGPFDDEETRDFYCDVPDLLTTIPPALLGIKPDQIEVRKEENLVKYGDSVEAEIEEETAFAEVTPTSEADLEADEEGEFEEEEEDEKDELQQNPKEKGEKHGT
jgi:regulator of nonsense transcripts 2